MDFGFNESESHMLPCEHGCRSKQMLSHSFFCPFTRIPYRMHAIALVGGVSTKVIVCVLAPVGKVIVEGVTVPAEEPNQTRSGFTLALVAESAMLYVQFPSESRPVFVMDFGFNESESHRLPYVHGGRSKHILSHTFFWPFTKYP